eukprot:9317168-Pyramimonas_sp.AAC.1
MLSYNVRVRGGGGDEESDGVRSAENVRTIISQRVEIRPHSNGGGGGEEEEASSACSLMRSPRPCWHAPDTFRGPVGPS